MDAGDLGAADVIGRAFGFVRLPIRGRIGEQREELGEIDHLGERRFLGGAGGRYGQQRKGEGAKSRGGFHSGIGWSVCTRITLTARFVKERSQGAAIWKSPLLEAAWSFNEMRNFEIRKI